MQLSFLKKILSQPTAPFRETLVVKTATEFCQEQKIPYFIDPVGNVVVGVKNLAQYRKLLNQRSSEPLRIFIAHMDHPGFLGERWLTPKRLQVRWYGGSPVKHLNGMAVWLADRDGYVGEGSFTKVKLHSSKRRIESAEIRVATMNGQRAAPELFGSFAFRRPVWQQGSRLFTKAADDLVGVAAILETAKKFGKGRHPFVGLLTRAEEVGFIGAIGHLSLGMLRSSKRKIVCVSLETSRQLPKAKIGAGPVVRLGDYSTVFDPGGVEILHKIARSQLPGKHQRAIMDGGSCEATAATVFGLPAIGISVPLGNYHNQSFEGGPEARTPLGPGPEFVDLKDVQGLEKLCEGLMEKSLQWERPWEKRRKDFEKAFRGYKKLLSIR